MVLIDITRGGPWPGFLKLVESYARRQDLPSTVGGNVRSWAYAQQLLNAGGDKVLVGYGGKDIYEEVAAKVGRQSLVAGIDVAAAGEGSQGRLACRSDNVANTAREAAALGAGEILLTNIDRDGSLGGLDCESLGRCSMAVGTPVIISGGCGSWQHMRQAFEAGAAGAVTSNIFHLNETAMRSCKQWLSQNYSGPVRPAESV